MVAIHIISHAASIGFVFPSQKARSLNIHQLLAEESEDKLEEYYRQKYATTSSARYETYDTGHVNFVYRLHGLLPTVKTIHMYSVCVRVHLMPFVDSANS